MGRVRLLVAIGLAWFASTTSGTSTAWCQQVETRPNQVALQQQSDYTRWLHDVFVHEMSAYSFYLDEARQHSLAMKPEPVLRYPSPPEDCWGEIYVWTDRGRAAVVGCVFAREWKKLPQQQILHEFHSLAPKALFSQGGATGWQPADAGIKFEPVPDAPEPATENGRRLAQMWAIARRFSAGMVWNQMKVELRFLRKPIYRYELPDQDSHVIDGALFGYCATL